MTRTVSMGALMLLWLLAGSEASSQPVDSIVVGSEPSGLELSALTAAGTWELRIYTINRGRLDDFVAAWREGVYPLRLEHGFKIYEGPMKWEDAQAAYYGSSQRQGLEVDPLDMIAHGDTWPITPAAADR